MIGQLLTGRLVDVLGTKIGFFIVMFVWSTAGMLCAAARGATANPIRSTDIIDN